jgi:lysophospholipase L1-like esterase
VTYSDPAGQSLPFADLPAVTTPVRASWFQQVHDTLTDLDGAAGRVGALETETADTSARADALETTATAVGEQVDALTAAGTLAPGLLWGFAGDSITHGSSAANFSYAFVSEAVSTVGGLVARLDSIEAGVPSITTTGYLTRMPTLLGMGVQAVCIMLGTNDAGTAVPLSTTVANLVALIGQAKAAGCAVVLCTIPPRGTSATAAIKAATAAINLWIRMAGPSYGCEVADAHLALVDSTTGDYATGMDSGDAVHPTTLGHSKVGQVVAAAMRRAARRPTAGGLVTAAQAVNLLSDPLHARATPTTSPWFEVANGTGSPTPTYTMVADTSGVLPAGRWAQMDWNATSGGTRRLSSASVTTGFTVGDRVLLTAHLQVEDVTGTWVADVAAGTANLSLQLVNQSSAGITGSSSLQRCAGIPSTTTAGVYDIGPVVVAVTVPTGTTGLTLWASLTLPTSARVKVRLGPVGLFNATSLGLTTYLPAAGAVVSSGIV